MNIGRKQALRILAGVAAMVPWFGKSASAAPTPPVAPTPIAPVIPGQPGVDAGTIEDLKKRLTALEAALAAQVGFTKDAAGNLTLKAAGSVSVQANATMSLGSGGTMTIKGATINLN